MSDKSKNKKKMIISGITILIASAWWVVGFLGDAEWFFEKTGLTDKAIAVLTSPYLPLAVFLGSITVFGYFIYDYRKLKSVSKQWYETPENELTQNNKQRGKIVVQDTKATPNLVCCGDPRHKFLLLETPVLRETKRDKADYYAVVACFENSGRLDGKTARAEKVKAKITYSPRNLNGGNMIEHTVEQGCWVDNPTAYTSFDIEERRYLVLGVQSRSQDGGFASRTDYIELDKDKHKPIIKEGVNFPIMKQIGDGNAKVFFPKRKSKITVKLITNDGEQIDTYEFMVTFGNELAGEADMYVYHSNHYLTLLHKNTVSELYSYVNTGENLLDDFENKDFKIKAESWEDNMLVYVFENIELQDWLQLKSLDKIQYYPNTKDQNNAEIVNRHYTLLNNLKKFLTDFEAKAI